MARFRPNIDPSQIELKPERDVALALANLPDDCTIFHSYPWLKPERNDYTRKDTLHEGEADFLIFSPLFGLMVLEVKGGSIGYDSTNLEWYRLLNDGLHRRISDPFRQAQRNTHAISDKIKIAAFSKEEWLPFSFGYAVVFPDCEYSGELPPGAEASVLLTSKDIPFLSRRIPEIAKKWDRVVNRKRIDSSTAKVVLDKLSPIFRLFPVLARQVESQEEALVRLTERQQEALEGLYANDRVLVLGTAGSGKTMLAMQRAMRFAEREISTLFLCYNKFLALSLSGLVPERLKRFLRIRHFHGLCWDLCSRNGIAFEPPEVDGDTFWKIRAMNLLDRAIDMESHRFEAIVVDEAQDFFPSWWLPIELLNRFVENGPLYIFCDPAQNLFLDCPLEIPKTGVRYELATNCRNTRSIANLCGQIQSTTISVRPEAPEGELPQIETLRDDSQQRHRCETLIRQWIKNGQLRPGQIAILSPSRLEHSCMSSVGEICGVPVVSDLTSWNQGKGILFSTIKAFKGLEADALVVVDGRSYSDSFHRSEMYVACSRAKHLLTVMTSSHSVV